MQETVREMLSIADKATGQTYEYYIICRFTAGIRDYIAVAPQFGDDNEIQLFRRSEDGKGIQLSNIPSDVEFERVKQEYEKIMLNERRELFKHDKADTAITISFENGAKSVCDIIGVFEYAGGDYIAVMPIDSSLETPIAIWLYKYAVISDDISGDSLSLAPIPEYAYTHVQEHFMGIADIEAS